MSTGIEPTITLTDEGDSWVAKHHETGIASHGETREEALDMLDDALALHRGDTGEEPTKADLREMGIDPSNNTSGSIEESDIFE